MLYSVNDDIHETFSDADVSLIKQVIYFDCWTTYEEHGGALIFEAIDDTFQYVPFGYNVMATDNSNPFQLTQISQDQIQTIIDDIEENKCDCCIGN